MHISRFQLNNYKSYYKSEPLELFPGINLIVGRNNVGKTALLEGLGLNFPNKPYRSSRIQRRAHSQGRNVSVADVSLSISRDELWEILRNQPNEFGVPLPASEKFVIAAHTDSDYSPIAEFLEEVFARKQFTFQAHFEFSDNNPQASLSRYPVFGIYDAGINDNKRECAFCKIDDKDRLKVVSAEDSAKTSFDFGFEVVKVLQERIYSFRAERLPLASCPIGNKIKLEPNASNLAEVLENLQGQRPKKFRELNDYVRYVFPHIFEVSVRHDSRNAQHREVIIYEEDSPSEEDAVPIRDSGTGIGQVLAMLYVLTASEFPQTIIIDEPQSFLHPGAVRKLFEIFNAHSQHQYIVATHMPNVIAASRPATVVLVQKERKQESKFRLIDSTDTEQLRLTLHEVGARLSDIFGADYILWVEGPTERDCFPLILEKLRPQRLRGAEFVPVLSVDATLGREADKMVRIYQQLSQGRGLLPPAVGFIFDRECRTDAEIADLERYANRTVKFIRRRMFENYLLKPEAIEAVLLDVADLSKRQVSAAKIEKWLNQEIKKPKYYCPKSTPKEPWIKFIDGARLLDNLFTHFSNTKLSYEKKKVEYGVKLTRWLLDNDPSDFEEIAKLVQALLPKDPKGAR